MLINTNNNTFLFVNSLGFNRATFGSSYDPMIYYFVRYPPDLNTTAKNELFNELKNYTINEYGYNTVYSINNKNQPNKILYI
ncbi:hypothetical protein IKD56_05250 [bacterium]|nr:hypothetical protein [bacterium]